LTILEAISRSENYAGDVANFQIAILEFRTFWGLYRTVFYFYK